MPVISINTSGAGLYEFTHAVEAALEEYIDNRGDDQGDTNDQSDTGEGLCTVFIQHTSASLIIQENADPSAKRDLENWLQRHVPQNDPLFTHTHEGPDDMPSHIKAALTQTSIGIPIIHGKLALGTWQGIYLWEHRTMSHRRRVVVSFIF